MGLNIIEWNGINQDRMGMVWNGMKWDGMGLNIIELNGINQDGMGWNSIEYNEMEWD